MIFGRQYKLRGGDGRVPSAYVLSNFQVALACHRLDKVVFHRFGPALRAVGSLLSASLQEHRLLQDIGHSWMVTEPILELDVDYQTLGGESPSGLEKASSS